MSDTFQVGDRVHWALGSDILPGTVVKVTKASVLVRHDQFQRDPAWTPDFRPGGFVGHVANNRQQKNIISEDPKGAVRKFTKRGPKDIGLGKTLTRFIPVGMSWTDNAHLRPGWRAFHDYNF